MYTKPTNDPSPFPQFQTSGLVFLVPLLDVTLDQPLPISRPQFPHLYQDFRIS